MSTASFMHGGVGELVREFPEGEPYGKRIRIYEIDEPLFVGIIYGELDRQSQPRKWWAGRIPAKEFPSGLPVPVMAVKQLIPRKKAAAPEPTLRTESPVVLPAGDSRAPEVAAPILKPRKKADPGASPSVAVAVNVAPPGNGCGSEMGSWGGLALKPRKKK